MHRRVLGNAVAAIASAGVVVLTAAPAMAQPTCDTYSQNCSDTGTTVSGTSQTQPAVATAGTASTLPFTGAEIGLMTVIGAGVSAGGVVLVAASRRRTRRADSDS